MTVPGPTSATSSARLRGCGRWSSREPATPAPGWPCRRQSTSRRASAGKRSAAACASWPAIPAPVPTAEDLDACDELAAFASEFEKPHGQVYLDGNSLGLLCRPAEEALREAVDSWRRRAILGWTDGPEPWFGMSRRVASLLAPIL